MWRQKETSQGSNTSVSITQLLCLESQSCVYIGAGIQQVELAIHTTCYIYSVWPDHRGNKSEWSVAAPVLKITPSSNNLQQLCDSPSCRCPSVMPPSLISSDTAISLRVEHPAITWYQPFAQWWVSAGSIGGWEFSWKGVRLCKVTLKFLLRNILVTSCFKSSDCNLPFQIQRCMRAL